MTKEQCKHPRIEEYPRDSGDYQCEVCLESFAVRLMDDEPASYSIEDAIRIAGLWRAGKMIGGDQDGVRDALLAEVERLRAAVEPTAPRNAARGFCQLRRAPACDEYPRCACGAAGRHV